MSYYICDGRHFGEIVEATFRERGPFNKWYFGKRKVAKIEYCDAFAQLRHRGKLVKEGSSFCEGSLGYILKGMNDVEKIESYYGITATTDLKLVVVLNVYDAFVSIHEKPYSSYNKFACLNEHVQPFACRFIDNRQKQVASFRVYVSGSGWRISPDMLERWGKAKLRTGGLVIKRGVAL